MLADPAETRLEAAPRATGMLLDMVATRMLADQEEARLEVVPLSFSAFVLASLGSKPQQTAIEYRHSY